MDDLIRQAMAILRGTWNRRWLGMVVAWVVGLGAAAVVMVMPDKYEASARIYVDTQSVLKPLMAGLAVQPNVDQQVMILSRTLISRPNVEKLIRMADLDHDLKSAKEQERLIDVLVDTLAIKSVGKDNLYLLSYRDSQPDQAKRVVQSLVSIFVESSLGDKRKDSDTAKKFIEEQIKTYEAKLQEAENRLKEFKVRNIGLTTQDGKDYFARMAEINTSLNQARLELHEAENSRDALKRQLTGVEPSLIPDSADQAASTSVPEIDSRIETLKKNLDNLLQRYTESHPDVIGTKRVIAQLEEQKKKELAERKDKDKGTPQPVNASNSNPVYQQIKVSLAEAEANVASLGTRVAEFQSRYNQLKDAARMVPQIEAEFAQLNRDYDIHKKNYESLVAKRESAVMSGEMESAGGLADFRLIDPPRVSPKPVAPNRLLLLPLALVLSLVAGIGSSFLASQLWPTFADARSLREVSGLPILGTVSMIVTEPLRRRERRSLLHFLAAFAALVGTFGAGMLALVVLSARVA